jgi:hypothetical protein
MQGTITPKFSICHTLGTLWNIHFIGNVVPDPFTLHNSAQCWG